MGNKPRPRITREQIADIGRLRAMGFGLREIAAELGVSRTSACRYGKARRPQRTTKYLIVPRVLSDSFIRPPSLAQLMAGR